MRIGPFHNWFWIFLLATAAVAQVVPASQTAPSSSPVPYASVSELNLMLSQLEQASQGIQVDLAKLRVEKWKTDSSTKRGAQGDVESVQRNLRSALPEIIGQLRASPESLTATFKLYRNMDALYNVFSSVAESAGAFGSRDEYQMLQNDLSELERARRSFADRMDALSSAKEGEISQLRTELRKLQVSATSTPPKKVVVDDAEQAKKPVKKKTPGKSSSSKAPPEPSAAPGTAPRPHP